MIRIKIQIENGIAVDSFSSYGFIFLDADKRVGAPEKGCDASNYRGENGEHLDPRTTLAPFDYKIKFLVQASSGNLQNANSRITAFNTLTRASTGEGDIIRKKQITVYTPYDGNKIVGYPEPIAEAEDFYYSKSKGRMDFVVAELTIHVSEPQLCIFGS